MLPVFKERVSLTEFCVQEDIYIQINDNQCIRLLITVKSVHASVTHHSNINRVDATTLVYMTKFQNGIMKGKSIVNNLFIIMGLINHAVYLN